MNTDIKTMTLTELKSLAYDVLGEIQRGQSNLQVINQEILTRSKPEQLDDKLPTDSKTVKN